MIVRLLRGWAGKEAIMPSYTLKNALLDLGFVDGCIREHAGEDFRMLDAVEAALDRIERVIVSRDIEDSRLLFDLGFVRGVVWFTPMTNAYSEALDRVAEFLVEGKVDWYQLPQPWRPREDAYRVSE